MAFDRPVTALIAYCEASSATPLERRCVVHSVFNRRTARFAATLAGVCFQRFQYSELNDDKINNTNLERGANCSDNDPTMLDCLAAYDEVLSAPSADPTGGATHYHEKAMKQYPSWTEKQPDGRQAVVTLTTEHFIFYSHVP